MGYMRDKHGRRLDSFGVADWADAPIYIRANDLEGHSGTPSKADFMEASGRIGAKVWSMSGLTAGQSIRGVVHGLPPQCVGVRIEIVVTYDSGSASSSLADVWKVHLGQNFNADYLGARPVLTPLEGSRVYRTITLESFYPVDPALPLAVRVERMPGDPSDTAELSALLVAVKVVPVGAAPDPLTVEDPDGYIAWPMIDALGDKLVCPYSRGVSHTTGEVERGTFVRTSSDRGKTWGAEQVIVNSADRGDVPVGKGLDADGAMLLWVRHQASSGARSHTLYRSTDGAAWAAVATPSLSPNPVQITDIFHVPTIGLMSLWFTGDYNSSGSTGAWGTLTSSDGVTWVQNTVEAGLSTAQWPTEQTAVYLGDGVILALGRSELGTPTTDTTRALFQLVSEDYGVNWTKQRTNITDVLSSTPTMLYDAETRKIRLYYYERARGLMRRRVADADTVLADARRWSESDVVAIGSTSTIDAGNANATELDGVDYVAYYSGNSTDTGVYVAEVTPD